MSETVTRQIVRIDEDLCTGCGACVSPVRRGRHRDRGRQGEGRARGAVRRRRLLPRRVPDGRDDDRDARGGAVRPRRGRGARGRRSRKTYIPQTCFRCGTDEDHAPLLPVRTQGTSTWVCTRACPPSSTASHSPTERRRTDSMYCNQCEQTLNGVALHVRRRLRQAARRGRPAGPADPPAALQLRVRRRGPPRRRRRRRGRPLHDRRAVPHADERRLRPRVARRRIVRRAYALTDELGAKVEAAGGTLRVARHVAARRSATPSSSRRPSASAASGTTTRDADVQSLQQTAIYGLKGLAAYAYHAAVLGQEDPELYAFVHKALAALTDRSLGVNDWVGLALEVGKWNLRAMELLDAGNTGTYGHPVPTRGPARPSAEQGDPRHRPRPEGPRGAARADRGQGHRRLHARRDAAGARLPGAQEVPAPRTATTARRGRTSARSSTSSPAPILFTTNCIQTPKETYRDNVFTTGPVAFPGTTHVANGEFARRHRARARAARLHRRHARRPARSWSASAARRCSAWRPTVIEAVKTGAIRHFFLVGGCDGAKPGRNYYTRLRGEGAGRHGRADAGLRQVPLLRQGPRRHRRHPAPARRRPVQRRLLGRQDRAGARRRVRGRRERAAAVDGAVVVRAEGRRDPADAAAPRHHRHPPRADAARVHHARTCCRCSSTTSASSRSRRRRRRTSPPSSARRRRARRMLGRPIAGRGVRAGRGGGRLPLGPAARCAC